jgi:purine-cytosine permease-like protein
VSIAGNAIANGVGVVLAVDTVFVLLGVVCVDTYSGMLTLVTALDSFRPVKPTRAIRTLFVFVFTALWVAVTLAVGQNAIAALTLTLTIILYLLVPWTAVNLVDFFFVRRGHYVIRELFNPRGMYGRWAWRGVLAYGLGAFAIVPFAVLPDVWTGSLAARIGGVDIGWLVGLVVAGGSYYGFSHSLDREARPVAPALNGADQTLSGVE